MLHEPQEFPEYPPLHYATFWLDPFGLMLEAVCHYDADRSAASDGAGAGGACRGQAVTDERRASVDTPTFAPVSEAVELTSGAGTVQFDLAPGALGYNDLFLVVSDTAGEPLPLVSEPEVGLREPDRAIGPLELPVHALDAGSYHVPVDLPFTGQWQITVDARTSTFETGSATITVTVD